MAKLEKTVVSLDSETKRVLNNLTRELKNLAMIQRSELQMRVAQQERDLQKSGVRIPSRLREPAEDLAGTNAAYEEEWCYETDQLKSECTDCKLNPKCDTI